VIEGLIMDVLRKHGVSDPAAVLRELADLGIEFQHSEMLQAARTLGHASLKDFWEHQHRSQISMTFLSTKTGFSTSTLYRSKKETLGILDSNIAAQTQIWGEKPKGK
jgi:hypothetical protein